MILILLFTCYLYVMLPFLHCWGFFLLLLFYFSLPTYFFSQQYFAKLVKIHRLPMLLSITITYVLLMRLPFQMPDMGIDLQFNGF